MRPPIAPVLAVQTHRLLAMPEQCIFWREAMYGASGTSKLPQQNIDLTRHALVRKHLVHGTNTADAGAKVHAEAVNATHCAKERVEEWAEVLVCEGIGPGYGRIDED